MAEVFHIERPDGFKGEVWFGSAPWRDLEDDLWHFRVFEGRRMLACGTRKSEDEARGAVNSYRKKQPPPNLMATRFPKRPGAVEEDE